MPEWTFLTNHAMVPSHIARHPRVTARDMANTICITERATRKVIADLLGAGYITKNGKENAIAAASTPTSLFVIPATGKPLWETSSRC